MTTAVEVPTQRHMSAADWARLCAPGVLWGSSFFFSAAVRSESVALLSVLGCAVALAGAYLAGRR